MALVEQHNVHASKNLMRLLAIAVDYSVVNSQAFSQVIIPLLDECVGGVNVQPQDMDMVLETVMAGLPIAA